MPWEVKRRGSSYAVVKKGTNKVVATHGSDKNKALAQVRAMYANYKGKKVSSFSGAAVRRTKKYRRGG